MEIEHSNQGVARALRSPTRRFAAPDLRRSERHTTFTPRMTENARVRPHNNWPCPAPGFVAAAPTRSAPHTARSRQPAHNAKQRHPQPKTCQVRLSRLHPLGFPKPIPRARPLPQPRVRNNHVAHCPRMRNVNLDTPTPAAHTSLRLAQAIVRQCQQVPVFRRFRTDLRCPTRRLYAAPLDALRQHALRSLEKTSIE